MLPSLPHLIPFSKQRPYAMRCALIALAIGALAAAPASAQDGAASGVETAPEAVDLPDPASPVLITAQEPGAPEADDALTEAALTEEAVAQIEAGTGTRTQAGSDTSTPQIPREIDFEADAVAYDEDTDSFIATGNVILRNTNRSVIADRVEWDRRSGKIVASGDVRFVDDEGNQLYTQRIELTEKFEAGAMEDLLFALNEGGRLAARGAERGADGSIALEDAAYSACAVTDPEGCERSPSWRITADRVTYTPEDNRLSFKGAYLELFGARLLPLPGLAVRTDGRPVSGFLVPDLRISESNGVEVSGTYYVDLGPNKDLSFGANLYTEAPPMVSAQYRHLSDKGAYQITGYLTHSRRISDFTGVRTSESDLRGYVFTNGKFQFSPEWSLTASLRAASDRTFLRRYDISLEDRLRSTVDLERIDDNSYLSVAAWGTQTLRLGVPQGQVPLVLPVIDYRHRIEDPVLSGTLELQLNSLSLYRDQGQDTQRAFAGARWDLQRLTSFGQMVTLTGMLRGDVYYSDENAFTVTESYRGEPGWQTRGVALAALDVQWPFVGEAFGGTQVITPRVQMVASPPIRNLAVPNEDARAIDLEDSNLFALNRFPGYDRIEDGARITYGFDYRLQIPHWEIKSTIGQSYRLDSERAILPDGTGLSERVSDFVGRTELHYRNFLRLTHRFRLDKDSLAIRRNEFDMTIGSTQTYAEIGYLRLNRNIAGLEDLQDREELRAAARVRFANYWSIFGSGVINLTDRDEDPTFQSDGFEPVRTRLGVAYQDDCLEFGLTWRRDFVSAGDAQRGDTFQLYFSLRNLGFR